MRHVCFIAVILLFSRPYVASAQGFRITGKVTDAAGNGMFQAPVLLMHDSTLAGTVLTGSNGDYLFENIGTGKYTVRVQAAGYTTSESALFELNGDMRLPPVIVRSPNKLGEIAVTASRPYIEMQHDKVVVNVDASVLNAGASVLEVLARSPGVAVDANDNIRLKGKTAVNIMIDGKPAPVSGDALANMLKSMPSNTIDRIELIANPSARHDAAGSGIINIRTKKEKRHGINGTLMPRMHRVYIRKQT